MPEKDGRPAPCFATQNWAYSETRSCPSQSMFPSRMHLKMPAWIHPRTNQFRVLFFARVLASSSASGPWQSALVFPRPWILRVALPWAVLEKSVRSWATCHEATRKRKKQGGKKKKNKNRSLESSRVCVCVCGCARKCQLTGSQFVMLGALWGGPVKHRRYKLDCCMVDSTSGLSLLSC